MCHRRSLWLNVKVAKRTNDTKSIKTDRPIDRHKRCCRAPVDGLIDGETDEVNNATNLINHAMYSPVHALM